MEKAGSNSLVRHAFKEQLNLSLSWNTNIQTARSVLNQINGHRVELSPSQIKEAMRSNFRQIWNTERLNNKKLTFYNTIKMSFGYEQYLNLNLSHAESKKLAQFRSSSHNFKSPLHLNTQQNSPVDT